MLFTIAVNGNAQNLVPNPSFEDTVYCPSSLSDYNAVDLWFNPTQHSPDYFNACSDSMAPFSANAPNNFFGHQQAKEGSGYIGVGVALYNNNREYFGIKLTDTLVAGKRYCVRFYISLADSVYYSTDNIGAYLSTDSIGANNTNALPFIPQVSNPIGSFVTDKNGWTLISGNFIATGGEEYLTIGNFENDNNTDTLAVVPHANMINNNYMGAYYYLDSISVQDCDTTTSISEVDNIMNFSIFPNPATNHFVINTSVIKEPYDITIYNTVGQLLFYEERISINNKKINIDKYDANVLLINIKTANQNHYYKLLKP